MRRLHLPIQNPCHEDWTAMESDGESRRFCDACTKHVHDLSAMTESMARTVLASESAKGRVCVRYTTDATGNIKFKTETVEAPSLWRMTLAAASMALALFATGCADSEPDRVTIDECVYEVGPWSFTAERGQGTCPAVDPEPEPMMMGQLEAVIDPPPEPIHEVMGDMPAEPITMGNAPMMKPPQPEPVPEPATMGKIAPPEPIEVKGEIAAVRAEEPCDPQEKTMLGEVL